jgi:CNT family concentrative nucleoside transporter
MNHFIGILGIILIIFLCWLMSEQKKAFPWRIVCIGLILQIIIGILVLKIPFGIHLLRVCGNAVTAFLGLASKGSEMLFGNIVKPEFAQTFGFQFAFTVLPAIIFFSSVMSIMYHLGIMQYIVRAMSWCMSKTLHTSGIESLSASANIF